MDYKKVLRLHYVNHLSGKEISLCCGDCGKTSVNEFLKRFRECEELSYPLGENVTNELIQQILYHKPGANPIDSQFKEINMEDVTKKLNRKGETLMHIWNLYYAEGEVDGKRPMSYRHFCRKFSEWKDDKKLAFILKECKVHEVSWRLQ